MKKIILQQQIIDLFPEFRREVILVRSLTNRSSYKPIRRILKQQIDSQNAIDLETDPRLAAWDEAHRKFGSSPQEYMPSVRSLMTRIQSNPALPFINSAVALFNYISLKYCLPCGGDDIAAIRGDLVLGIADGSETFLGLGSDRTENPFAGEVIYFDSDTKNVMCRRWNWRNGEHTKIEPQSQCLVINIDCLPPISKATGIKARDELAGMLEQYCDARVETVSLHSGYPEHAIG